MKLLRRQSRQKGRLSGVLHILAVAALPAIVYVLIRLELGWLAVTMLLLSKWRMLAVKARHWPANIRANAVDIFVGISVITFMSVTDVMSVQLMWVAIWVLWLLIIKPKSMPIWIGLQALISQAFSLAAIFYFWSESSTAWLVFATWGVSYISARHFLTAFDEGMSRATAYSWAFFTAAIAWLSGHWLIFYGPIAQPAILLTVLGYGLASMYYLDHKDKLTRNYRLQFIFIMAAVVLILIVFSEWTDKTV